MQLLLIVDYILDWARDVYRPSILRQLKALVRAQAYDQISLINDDDIQSLRRDVSVWMSSPPDTIFDTEPQNAHAKPISDLDILERLRRLIPNTKLGTLRSASVVHSRTVGLYLNEQSARSLMELAGAANQNQSTARSEARSLINFVTQWNDSIVLTAGDLAGLEEMWTGPVNQIL